MKAIDFTLRSLKGDRKMRFEARELICAGFTGRDQESVRKHVKELSDMGIKPPETIPAHYAVPENLITTQTDIAVQGTMTSGEVESVVLFDGEDAFVTVGSDHTDREMEKSDILRSKGVCPKIVARDIWPYEEVAQHWDSLEIKSSIYTGNEESTYQQGALAELMPPYDVLEKIGAGRSGLVLYCGTLPVRNGRLVYADRFGMEIRDPVLNRAIRHQYSVTVSDR